MLPEFEIPDNSERRNMMQTKAEKSYLIDKENMVCSFNSNNNKIIQRQFCYWPIYLMMMMMIRAYTILTPISPKDS